MQYPVVLVKLTLDFLKLSQGHLKRMLELINTEPGCPGGSVSVARGAADSASAG